MEIFGIDITSWISDFFIQIGNLLTSILVTVLSILPDSPFQRLTSNAEINVILGYINYFIPVGFFMSVLQGWLIAIGIFYMWQIILRFIKAIE